jgi:CubicO group peptidase (beta-lactamase class C family)
MHGVLLGILTAIALLVRSTPLMAGDLPSAPPSLRSNIERALKDEGLVGAVWVTLAPTAGESVGAAGLKDANTGELMTERHRVHVGSVTKTLLALGVMRLVTQDRLTLDDPISRLLPELRFDNPWEESDPVRLRHLLDHTAGLDDARLWQVFSLKVSADTPLADAFAGDETLLKVRVRPGSRFSYSNMGYGLLGMVIEAITGERYEHYLNQHLLQPLRMSESTFSFVSQSDPGADHRLAMGHFERSLPQAAVPSHLRPATQFTTTASDMAAVMRLLLGDGTLSGETFIEADLLRSMGTPYMTEAAVAGLPMGYGLGLGSRDRHGVIALCHGGNTVGFRAMLCVFREQQKAFFIAINADSETADYERFNALLIDALDVTSSTPQPAGSAPDVRDWEGVYVAAPPRFASFAWLDTVFGFVRLQQDGTSVRLRSPRFPQKQLIASGGLLFRASDRTTASHVLLTSAEGKRVLSDGLQSFEQVPLAKMMLLWTSLGAGILGILYTLISGIANIVRRRSSPSHPMFFPFVATLALLLPLPLFYLQSFVELGDITVASVVLAIVTTTLPIGMIFGLVRLACGRARSAAQPLQMMAVTAVLQAIAVLAIHGLMPLLVVTLTGNTQASDQAASLQSFLGRARTSHFRQLFVCDAQLRFFGLIEAASQAGFLGSDDSVEADVTANAYVRLLACGQALTGALSVCCVVQAGGVLIQTERVVIGRALAGEIGASVGAIAGAE